MDRHVFFQKIEGARVVERAMRSDDERPITGYVLEAPYLEVGRDPVQVAIAAPAGWFERLRRWLEGGGTEPRATPAPARGTQLRLLTPFGPEGQDALGLFERRVPFVSPEDTITAGVRCAGGRVVPLQGGDPLIFDDLWVDDHGWRVSQGRDFAVLMQDRKAVIVSCGLAPLIVAQPRRVSVAEHQLGWSPRLLTLHSSADAGAEGWSVSLHEGDEVEVLGVVRPLRDSQRSFQIDDGSYRRIPARPAQVLGDEDGTRLVMRVTCSR